MKIVFLVVLLLANSAFGGGGGIETSGGGAGVLIQGRMQLLDLIEAGVHTENLQIPLSQVDNPFYSRLERFSLKSEIELPVLAYYLDLIWKKNPFLADALVKTVLLYQWNLVSEPLRPHPPNTVIVGLLNQIALRKGACIYIDSGFFHEMDRIQKVALVLHEALSALGNPEVPESRPRQIIGAVFSSDFQAMSGEDFEKLLGHFYLPIGKIRESLGAHFKDTDREMQTELQYKEILHTAEASPLTKEQGELLFFPFVQFRPAQGGSGVISKPFTSLFGDIYACDRAEKFNVFSYYFFINVTIPIENNEYAPYVLWSVQPKLERVIFDFQSCSPDSQSILESLFNHLQENFPAQEGLD